MNGKAFIAEFIGTFALVFIGVGVIAHDQGNLVAIALAHGLTIAVMASATGAISGGHLNPAVTIGLLTAGKIDLPNAIGYIISQVLGALIAAAAMLSFYGDKIAAGVGTPAPADGVSTSTVIIVEIILTFFLVFVIYGTAVDKRAPQVGALFIGLTVAIDIFMGGPITGAAMNPARHFGPAFFAGGSFLAQTWIYWLAPIVGGVLAAQLWARVLEEK